MLDECVNKPCSYSKIQHNFFTDTEAILYIYHINFSGNPVPVNQTQKVSAEPVGTQGVQ